MKKIKLGKKDLYVLIDDDDYKLISKYKWHSQRSGNMIYAVSRNTTEDWNFRVLMHRFLLNAPVGIQVDHKNRNGLDNQRHNIRLCVSSENQYNKIGWSKSGFKGVGLNYYKMKSIRYRAYIQYNKKLIHLGYYNTAEDAARVYDIAAKKYFGEFAFTNFDNYGNRNF